MLLRSFLTNSRKSVWLVLTAVVMVNVVVISYLQLVDPVVDVQMTLKQFLLPTEFKKKAALLFSQIKNDKARFWLADSSLCHVEAELPVSKLIVPANENGPVELFYDPRLTLAAYMETLASNGDTPELPELPFHWTDWVDVTQLNQQTALDEKRRITCNRLKMRARNHNNPDYYCKDKSALSDTEIAELGFKDRATLPEAVIHNHLSHDDLTYNDNRVFMAKSYVMTHLPKPFKVMMLNAEGGTYEFMVDQNKGPDQRMIYNGMITRLVELITGKAVSKVLQEGGTVTVNHLKVYEKLLETTPLRHMSPEEDVNKMHAIVTGPAGSSKDLHMRKEEFDYPKDLIDKQVEELKAVESRDILEENYLEGLEQCLKYDGKSEPTYFKMATLDIRESRNQDNDWGWHYDWRFFSDALYYKKKDWTMEERVERSNIILERLLRNWNRFAEEKGIVSWIMHGPLLSWYWDGLMFPYDVDIDIQMSAAELARLSRSYNQTLVVEDPTEGYGRFLIDCGTWIHNRDESTTGNHIDARFVDVDSGIYIDITALSKSNFNLPDEYKKNPIVIKNDANAEVFNDRRKHFYTLEQLLPLHYSMMGGVPVFVPNQIEERLRFEYSKGLDSYEFKDWYFVPKIQLWVMARKLLPLFKKEDYTDAKGNTDSAKVVVLAKEMSDQKALELLQDDEILREYYLTSKYTDWHMEESAILFTSEGKDNRTALDDEKTRNKYDKLVGKISLDKPLRKCLYEYEQFDRLSNH